MKAFKMLSLAAALVLTLAPAGFSQMTNDTDRETTLSTNTQTGEAGDLTGIRNTTPGQDLTGVRSTNPGLSETGSSLSGERRDSSAGLAPSTGVDTNDVGVNTGAGLTTGGIGDGSDTASQGGGVV